MESLALIDIWAAYDDPNPPQIRSFKQLSFKIQSSAWIGLASAVLALCVITSVPQEAQAAIRRGNSGADVRQVQVALINNGLNPGAIDGVFGNSTESAVIQFQKSKGLYPDGIVGPSTAAALGVGGTSTGGGGGGGSSYITIATNGSSLNVRSGPGFGYPVIGSFANGTTVRTSGKVSGGWVQLANGGWVSGSWLAGGTGGGGGGNPGGGKIATVVTNGSPLLIRSGPGGAVIGSLANGKTISLTGNQSGGWLQLSKGGWVSSQWVR